jgi:hypothetical protein
MNKNEFDQLRALPGKSIQADINFAERKDAGSDNLIFEQIEVQNSLDWPVVLNGNYKPSIPSITFNFVIRGAGPICRVCVNGTVHGNAGRTHKHDLQTENDSRQNLPVAVARPDLAEKSVREVWQILCSQANITHTGTFNAPDEEGDKS